MEAGLPFIPSGGARGEPMYTEQLGLTRTQVEQFETDGFVVVEDVIDPEYFAPLMSDYSDILDEVAADLLSHGEISTYDPTADFQERVLDVVRQAGTLDLGPFDIILLQQNVHRDTPMYLGEAAFNIMRHPRLLDAVESLIGPEIYSNPIQHIRLKVPLNLHDSKYHWSQGLGVSNTTSWHQDGAVTTEDSDDTKMITAWVAVTDVTEENGCLAVIPQSHIDGLAGHCVNPSGAGTGLVIPDHLIPVDKMTPLPVRAGGVILFARHTMHRALPNVSDSVRWSLDLRYQPTGQPTGRAFFPGFVARSRKDPSSELHDHAAWVKSWHEVREIFAERAMPKYNRWKSDAPWCA